MIKVYCDYCQKEIESSNEQVNLDFNAFGCTGFPTDKEYQLHIKCACRVKNKLEDIMKPIDHPTEKGGEE
jgi:hypothetical protein